MPYFVSYHILYYMMLDLHGFLLSSDQIVQGMMCVHERYGTVCVCERERVMFCANLAIGEGSDIIRGEILMICLSSS